VTDPAILKDIAAYYGDRLRRFGCTPAGVDWRDAASQATRFEQLVRLIRAPDASVMDFGCGYGALLNYLRAHGFGGFYHGIDIAPEMVAAAKAAHVNKLQAGFELGATPSCTANFVVTSGIFNLRLGHSESARRDYIEAAIAALDRAGEHRVGFNCLTAYSEVDSMRPDLYYAHSFLLSISASVAIRRRWCCGTIMACVNSP
jgi:SAM-dependent methyltransferase